MNAEFTYLPADHGGAAGHKTAPDTAVAESADVKGAEPHRNEAVAGRVDRGSGDIADKGARLNGRALLVKDETTISEGGVRATHIKGGAAGPLPGHTVAAGEKLTEREEKGGTEPPSSTLGEAVGQLIPRVAVMGPDVRERNRGKVPRDEKEGGAETSQVNMPPLAPTCGRRR